MTAEAADARLWRRVMVALEGEIASGALAPGARLPTEAQLAQRFAVNRHTVRRALDEMSRAGLVRAEQGRGSFVPDDVLDFAIASRTRFSEWIRSHNREPSGEVLELHEAVADAEVARGLALHAGARIVLLERLGRADGQPVSIGTHHFPSARFPGLLAALRREATVSGALAACGVADYRRAVSRVSARMPTPREAELLMLPRNRPLLVSENVNVDRAGAVVEFGVSRYPTPRVQLVFEPAARS